MPTYVVGLTGGIGSGKSAAADRFAAHNIAIVDADIASRAVVEPGQPALEAIADHFGSEIIVDGQLDRTALRHKVFADESERHWLQSLLHPLINAWLKDQIAAATSPYVVLVNPLLFETRHNMWCNRVLVVDVPEEVQLRRTMERDGNTEEQVRNIMNAQADRVQRNELADDIIVNDRDLDHLYSEVDRLHEVYLQSCQKQHAS